MAEHEADETRAPQSSSQTNPYAGSQQGYQSPYSPGYSGGYTGGGGGFPGGGGMQQMPQTYQSYQHYQPYQGGFPQQQGQSFQPQAVSPGFSGMPQTMGAGQGGVPPSIAMQTQTSYIENILRMNAGKEATVYMTFEGSSQWTDKVFKGVIEAAGKDHIILRDPQTQRRYLLLMIYLDYVVFESQINYYYPEAPGFYSISQ